MPKPGYNVVFIIIFYCISCASSKQSARKDWIDLQLPVGWSIKAPKGFKVKMEQGVDSYPGVIYNSEGSIIAYFDSGSSGGGGTEENLSKAVRESREEMEQDWFKRLYGIPKYNTAYLDTIDQMVAIIIKPKYEGKNILSISIDNQKANAGIAISRGIWDKQKLSIEEESLLLQMFKTIKFSKESLDSFYKSFRK